MKPLSTTVQLLWFLLLIISLSLQVRSLSTENLSNTITCWTQVSIPCGSNHSQTMSDPYHERQAGFQLQYSALREFEQDDDCYPWMFHDPVSHKCNCSHIPHRSLRCDLTIQRISIQDCYCITYNSDSNETELGRCVYGRGHKTDTVYYTLPKNKEQLNNYTCGKFYRDSALCGKCLPGYSPLVYSYELMCMNCTAVYMPYNWLKYMAVAYVPLTIFFFIVVFFNFNGTSPLLKGCITICQGLASPVALRGYFSVASKNNYIDWAVKIVGSMYGFVNLDFFRTVVPPICVNIPPLQILALDYAVAFYPLVLVTITYSLVSLYSRDVRVVVCLLKPFHKLFTRIKQNWELEGSIVKALATFFLLSYLKVLNVTVELLVYTEMFVLKQDHKEYVTKHVLYYDSSVEYFGSEHLPYAILALLAGVFAIVFPIIFLIVYPMKWFQKCLNAMNVQRQRLDTFVNCYQGYYKDGTNGTRDFRWFSVSYFVLQLIIYIAFTLSQSIYSFALAALATIILMFLQFSIQPYKEKFKSYNIIDGFMLLVVSAVLIMALAGDEADIKASRFSKFSYYGYVFFAILPFVYLMALGIWWLFMKKQLKDWCMSKLFSEQTRTRDTLQQLEEREDNDIPHRLEHPADYSTPLLADERFKKVHTPSK